MSEDQLETDYSSTNCKYLNKLRFIYRMKIMAYKISGQFKIVKSFWRKLQTLTEKDTAVNPTVVLAFFLKSTKKSFFLTMKQILVYFILIFF